MTLIEFADKGFEFIRDLGRVRSLGAIVRRQKGVSEFTSEEARAFLLLHGKELEDRLDKTLREFMKEKL